MYKLFTIAIIVAFTTACNNPKNTDTPSTSQSQNVPPITLQDSAAVVNDPKSYLNIQATNFSEIDTSGILLFPLGMGESNREDNLSSYKSMPNSAYWNIAFYNTKTGEQHLLSDKKMLIENFETNYEDALKSKLSSKFIFYSITTEDFNGDKKFTNEDATYLFITDKAGNNLKQISPNGYNVENWNYINSSKKIIMTLKKDSDKNKAFEVTDEVTNFEYDLEKQGEANEIFNIDFKNKLKVLFDRDWKKIK